MRSTAGAAGAVPERHPPPAPRHPEPPSTRVGHRRSHQRQTHQLPEARPARQARWPMRVHSQPKPALKRLRSGLLQRRLRWRPLPVPKPRQPQARLPTLQARELPPMRLMRRERQMPPVWRRQSPLKRLPRRRRPVAPSAQEQPATPHWLWACRRQRQQGQLRVWWQRAHQPSCRREAPVHGPVVQDAVCGALQALPELARRDAAWPGGEAEAQRLAQRAGCAPEA